MVSYKILHARERHLLFYRFDYYPNIPGQSQSYKRKNTLLTKKDKGLAEYVLQHVENPQSRGLVIGHDHRHNSEHWANLTTQTFIAKGIKVYTLRGLNHTPM